MRKAWNIRTGRTHTAVWWRLKHPSRALGYLTYTHTSSHLVLMACRIWGWRSSCISLQGAHSSSPYRTKNAINPLSCVRATARSPEARPANLKTQSVISASQKTSNSPVSCLGTSAVPLGCPASRAGGVALPFTDPDQPAAQHDISLSPSHLNRLGWVYARSPNQDSIFGSFSIVRRES
ncbi:hypothetical protein QC762_112015 [Podospora pseudocomata]|uniref:Uncharacterized protein n=1 Tax=Podospora pseudocomata TaxID=2093779 RepID=A0ABR0GV53_9PEZI|nr:hypothetical protein QC762_112015 [Podospora pseudocomata]